MDPAVKLVIDAAKRAVVSANLQSLELESILTGLALLRSDDTISSAVADCLGTKTILWPKPLVELAEAAAKIDPETVRERKFELGVVFKKIYNDIRREVGEPSLADFLKATLTTPDALACEAVTQLHSEQKSTAGTVKQAGMLARLRELSQQSRKIQTVLSRDVIGQDDAVRMLADGYLRSIRQQKTTGLRGIFTFMGPPGVGKTMLAEHFAGALSAVEGNTYGTQKFSMEMADDESLLFTLFGVDSAYRTAKTGVLYNKIEVNPRQVIVFDEVEKAPPQIVQALLTLLNDGSFRDSFNQELVDLSQCFVIFTTNLGQDLFASRNRSGILRGSSFSSDDLFDLLATAKRREQVKLEHAAAALAPEFVSRLRKGGAVLFNQLTGSDYIRLIESVLGQQASTPNLHLPCVSISDNAKQLLVLSLLPDISPRKVVGEATMLRERWIDGLLAHTPANLAKCDPDSFDLRVEQGLDQPSLEILQNLRSGQNLKILIADNDHRMAGFIDRYVDQNYSETNPSVIRVDDPTNTLADLSRVQPDLLLLDLDLPDERLPAGGVLGLHRKIIEAAPDLPVFLFSESSDWAAQLPAILEQGGARGFISFKQEESDIVIDQDQQSRFSRLLADTLFEKIMAGLVRTRKKLDLDYHYEFRSEVNAVVVAIHHLKLRQIVSMSEESGGIRPSPIPSVTFDDVFGLERAKERLRDAIGWMKSPGLLRAFDVRPPSGFLLAGPSGTGKTHLARAVANAAGCVFYSLSAGELESKWIGEGEERIRQLFAAARKYAPSVIFIDEIDAIAGTRSTENSGSANHVKMLNQLLVCMDGFSDAKGQILVLAATNRPEALDSAILRPGRFDETIRIEAPDAKAREQMLRKRLSTMPIEDGVLDTIPRLICRTAGLSPAQVDRVVREAAYLAARESRNTLTLADLEAATNLVRYGANRRDMIVSEKDRRLTAWHEAGHAIARLTLFPNSKLDYLSIVPNEAGALGFAAWQPDETKHSYSAEDYRNLIIVALAGREAEKLCPGAGPDAINTGVSSDYERATALAWDAVSRYGFDEEFGVISNAGVPQSYRTSFSQKIRSRVDALLQECLSATIQHILDHKSQLSILAEALFENQVLDGKNVEIRINHPR